MWLPVVVMCIWSLGCYIKPVDSSYFMGGLIHWRPVNRAEFDGRVQLTNRITLKLTNCAQILTINTTILDSGSLSCQTGCIGDLRYIQHYCTDFTNTNGIDGWSAGEETYTYNFGTEDPYFEASYHSNSWISLVIGGGNWELRIKGNLTHRDDTGLINSSPVVNIPSVIYLQHGCRYTIKIPEVVSKQISVEDILHFPDKYAVEDADGDYVYCRWAESSLGECGEVCRSFPANLNGRDCELQYVASNATGDYAVALQVEDFASTMDITPLSSIPIQFVVRVQAVPSNPSCNSQPELVGITPLDGACLGVPFNTSWSATIIARVSDRSTAMSITDFVTASLLGMRKSGLVQSDNQREWQMNVTWTPADESQYGSNIFCYAALDSIGLQSPHRCVTLLAGVEPPMMVPGSMSPTGEIFSNQNLWSVKFDKQFIRPTKDTFIRIFGEQGEELFSINVKTSSAVMYPNDSQDHTLIFDMNGYQLLENHQFYILLDAGVAVGIEFCKAESPPMIDPMLWTFVTTQTHTATQGKEEENKDIIIVISTVFAFVLGIFCGLLACYCISMLVKRKAANLSSRQQSANMQIKQNEDLQVANALYEEVNAAARYRPSDTHVELKPNTAYGQY